MKPTVEPRWIKTTLCTVLLVALTGCASAVKTLVFQNPKAKKIFTPPKPDRTVTGKGWTNSIGDGTNLNRYGAVQVIYLNGSPVSGASQIAGTRGATRRRYLVIVSSHVNGKSKTGKGIETR